MLACFRSGDKALGNQEIARRTGLPKPTVSRLTFTLSSLGYLVYSSSLEKYALGGKWFLTSADGKVKAGAGALDKPVDLAMMGSPSLQPPLAGALP